MKTGNPFDMEILFVEKNVPFTKEKEYHVGFRDLHHRDEWFRFEGRLKIWLESKRK